MGIKNNKLWTVVALVLAGLTVWAVFSMSGEMSVSELLHHLKTADARWLSLSVLFMFGIIFFEGEALLVILKSVGYPRNHRRGFLYGAADVYFSAITPSASGGQPASAFFMIKDGIPGAIVTAVLLLNLVMYTLAILSIAVCCICVYPAGFLRFKPVSRVLIVLGMAALAGLGILFYMLLRHHNFLFGIARRFLGFLNAHHLLRHPEKKLERLEKAKGEYADCVALMKGHTPMLIRAYLLNLLQRLSQFMVILTVYMATGGSLSKLGELFATQCYIILGSNCVPVPGGMGVTDYLMLDGYGQMFDRTYAFQLEMLGRGISFYICIMISAVSVAIGYFALRKRERGREK